jgi:hypothetical protein
MLPVVLGACHDPAHHAAQALRTSDWATGAATTKRQTLGDDA